MSDLLKPSTYRLPEYQEEWLHKKAQQDGFTTKVNILRKLIDQAMKRDKVTK